MGKRAGYCQGGNTEDDVLNYKRGLECLIANHGRVLEYVNVEALITGYSARVIREWYTHIGGAPTRLQASTRYIDYGDFKFVIPDKIKNNAEALREYELIMQNIANTAKNLEKLGVPREDAAMVLPLGMETAVVDKRNLRNVIDMSGQRMCTRAYHEYRDLFNNYCDELKKISAEWEYIVENKMMPKCELLGYCPEKKSCGRKPKREGNDVSC